MQPSANRQQQTGNPSQRVTRSVVLFAKALTASDCCTSISKGGRITIPRVAVESNLPSVADKKHHEVVALDANDIEWTFVIKSWPNGGENKRVYVMEKTAPYMRRNKMKIGDVIAITRRPDAQLGVEFNSEAALHAVSQGRGFCDNGKPAAVLRHNPLAGLAAVAEQASNGPAGYGEAHATPKARTLAADRPPSTHSPQGVLVGKILTKADVEHCRVVLPRMAMEANMPEVVDANLLHVELLDESGLSWPVTLSMSCSGIAKRMFILEKIGVYLQQHNLKPGDCIAIKRTYDDLLHVVINPDAPANVREGPAVSGKDIDAVPAVGVVTDSADSMDVSRRQSVRRRRFKSGCEVNFARMLCGSLNRNGLADPFKNNEDDTFPEEQLPPPLQEHEPPIASDRPSRRARHADAADAAPGHSQHLMHHFPVAQLQHQALRLQHTGSRPVQFPSFFDIYPAHAQAASQAFAAHGAAPHTMQQSVANVNGNGDAGPSGIHGILPNHQMADLPVPRPLSGMSGARDSALAGVSPAVPTALGPVDMGGDAGVSQTAAPSTAAEAAAAAPVGMDELCRVQQAGSSTFTAPPYTSSGVGTTGIMHRPVHYPTPTSGVPSLFHTSLPPAGIPQPDGALSQGLGAVPGLPSSSFPTSCSFPPNSSAADMFPPNLYYGAAADAARLYAHHMAPFAETSNISPYGPAGLSTFLPIPLAATGLQPPKVEGMTVVPPAPSQTHPAGSPPGAAVETGRKRKTPGSSQKKAGKGAAAEVHGPVIARRAANRPPPQVPHGSLGKGSGTPKNLARSHVLVAKVLTNSDTHGRIILPRVSVEANLTFLMGYRSYSLPVKDRGGRTWEFVIKSWANGTENRRVYVLEQTGEYLKVNRLGVGDAVGICTNEDGDLVVASNSEEVRQATVRPTYGAAAVQHMPPPPPGKAESFTNGAPGRCSRSPCCTKFAGHSGFCSGPRALNESNGAARLRQDEPEEPTDQLQRRSSAAAAQEEAEDLSAAEEVVAGDMAVGTLVITHLTPQDLRAKEILLPKQAVEANILPALTYSLLKFKVIDDKGREHEVLLRSFVHGQETMYLLDRLADLLHSVNAQAGDMLMLTRDETGPVKVHLESIKYNHGAADGMARHTAFRQAHEDADGFDDDKAQFGSVLLCTRTSGCAKSAGHQGFCSGHKGFRRRFFEDMPTHADDRSSGDWCDCGSGTDSQEEDDDAADQLGPLASRFSGSPRNNLGKRKGHSHGAAPAKRAAVRQEVRVTCGSSSGMYDITRGCIALRAAQHGQIVNLELSPSEFEEHVMGCKQDWKQSLLVEVGQQDRAGMQQALPLGTWLHQHSIAVDQHGVLMPAKSSRFAREAGLQPQPSLSGPPAHHTARTSKAGRPLHLVEIATSGRARSLPTLAKAAAHTHLARFASKPVPRAYVPKRARSKAGGMSGRTEAVTSQDSLAAEVLLSLCPSGFRETGNDVADGVVESAAPLPVEEPLHSAGSLPMQQPLEPAEPTPDEQKGLCQTERTLSIPLVDSRGYGGMANMDPAGSAVFDQIFDGAGHLLEAMEAN
ncbi:hypothetical protein WJX77_008756 [Trebouxia sp. C0004]